MSDDSFSDLDDIDESQCHSARGDDFGFRDAATAIAEEEKKRELSFMFNVPENVSIHQRKEHSWEPSVLNGTVMSEEPEPRSVAVNDNPADLSRRLQAVDLSTKEKPQPAANANNLQSFSESIVDPKNVSVPWQSTPIANKAKSRTPQRMKSRIFPDLSESQLPATIGINDVSVRNQQAVTEPPRSQPQRQPQVPALESIAENVAPTNSMIADLLDANAHGGILNASQFLDGFRKKRGSRKQQLNISSMGLNNLKGLHTSPKPNKSSLPPAPRPNSRFGSNASIATAESVATRPSSSASNRPDYVDEPIKVLSSLLFGFVAIGDKAVRDYEVENNTDQLLTVNVHLQARETKQVFSLSTNVVHIPPKGKKIVSVTFHPTQRCAYNSNMHLSVMSLVHNRRIALGGHGGTAVVQPVLERGLSTTKQGCLVLATSNQSVVALSLSNVGNRSAFVHCVIAPMEGEAENSFGRVTVESSDAFILGPGETKHLKIYTECSSRPIGNFRLFIYWGEETQRQRLKVYEMKTMKECPYEGISFTVIKFEGEDDTAQSRITHLHKGDRINFFDNMRRTEIHVLNSRHSISRGSLDDSDMTLTDTFADATFTPGTSVVYDVTRSSKLRMK